MASYCVRHRTWDNVHRRWESNVESSGWSSLLARIAVLNKFWSGRSILNKMHWAPWVKKRCPTWNSRRTKTKVWTLCPFLELGTKHPLRSYRDKVWIWDKRMYHLEKAIPRDPSHNQPPNTNTTVYTSKILLKGPRYSCLLCLLFAGA